MAKDNFPMAAETGSKAFVEHGYDMNTGKMRVKFKGTPAKPGHTYELDGVLPERYAGFTGAKSMGGFYAKHIAPFHTARKVK